MLQRLHIIRRWRVGWVRYVDFNRLQHGSSIMRLNCKHLQDTVGLGVGGWALTATAYVFKFKMKSSDKGAHTFR